MNMYKDLELLPVFHNAVITIGTFDGVHEGHKKILAQLKAKAKEVQGETVVITFYPHPRKVVGDTSGVNLINTLEEKLFLLEKEGIDNVVVVPFNEHFSTLSAEEYINDFLYKKFKPHTLIIGYDHRFGFQRKGDYHLLEQYGEQLGFLVQEINAKVIAEAAISSTRVRKALLQADVQTAKELLGYNYFFEGSVIKGDQLGRSIGYPTANLQLNNEEKLVPADGVYAVEVYRQQTTDHRAQNEINKGSTVDCGLWTMDCLKGMMYIGSRPVVNGKRRVIEVNIFDFDEDIYHENLQVVIKNYIRGDMHLNSLEELKHQLALDKEAVIQKLSMPQ
ncbi:MAG: riboflavin biosynthesis protein RibF [Chitinophagaceae bacterium]|nr:riboflavin biosynthesis protein RibF [Chitinophagaceae bacterium]MCW5905463.1 riboflavin biosynthesis protein RibF [Chitinophagaceae bacterium]